MYYELIRLLHFAVIFALAGALVIENMAIKPQISVEDIKNLVKVDAVYSLSAFLVFLFGLVLWLWVGKTPKFYSANPVFHIKLGLFVLMVLCSIYPTLFFRTLFLKKPRKEEQESIEVPLLVRGLVKFQLLLLFVIPFLALLMARGVGLSP